MYKTAVLPVERQWHGANGGIRTLYLILTKDVHIHMRFKGLVSSPGVEPGCSRTTLSTLPVYQFQHEDLAALVGFEPTISRLKGGGLEPLGQSAMEGFPCTVTEFQPGVAPGHEPIGTATGVRSPSLLFEGQVS